MCGWTFPSHRVERSNNKCVFSDRFVPTKRIENRQFPDRTRQPQRYKVPGPAFRRFNQHDHREVAGGPLRQIDQGHVHGDSLGKRRPLRRGSVDTRARQRPATSFEMRARGRDDRSSGHVSGNFRQSACVGDTRPGPQSRRWPPCRRSRARGPGRGQRSPRSGRHCRARSRLAHRPQ